MDVRGDIDQNVLGILHALRQRPASTPASTWISASAGGPAAAA
jgi:hypothetical protein